MRRLRFRLGKWLLKPVWLPLLEHYGRLAEDGTLADRQREHCAYISIGIKYVVTGKRLGS